MSNPFDEIRAAVSAAKTQLRAADETAADMAGLLKGRLRMVGDGYWAIETLRALKKELREFDMTTGRWKA